MDILHICRQWIYAFRMLHKVKVFTQLTIIQLQGPLRQRVRSSNTNLSLQRYVLTETAQAGASLASFRAWIKQREQVYTVLERVKQSKFPSQIGDLICRIRIVHVNVLVRLVYRSKRMY